MTAAESTMVRARVDSNESRASADANCPVRYHTSSASSSHRLEHKLYSPPQSMSSSAPCRPRDRHAPTHKAADALALGPAPQVDRRRLRFLVAVDQPPSAAIELARDIEQTPASWCWRHARHQRATDAHVRRRAALVRDQRIGHLLDPVRAGMCMCSPAAQRGLRGPPPQRRVRRLLGLLVNDKQAWTLSATFPRQGRAVSASPGRRRRAASASRRSRSATSSV